MSKGRRVIYHFIDTAFLIDEKGVNRGHGRVKSEEGGQKEATKPARRRCSNCGKTGHYAKACQEDEENF